MYERFFSLKHKIICKLECMLHVAQGYPDLTASSLPRHSSKSVLDVSEVAEFATFILPKEEAID